MKALICLKRKSPYKHSHSVAYLQQLHCSCNMLPFQQLYTCCLLLSMFYGPISFTNYCLLLCLLVPYHNIHPGLGNDRCCCTYSQQDFLLSTTGCSTLALCSTQTANAEIPVLSGSEKT